jgi:hypothetical protein
MSKLKPKKLEGVSLLFTPAKVKWPFPDAPPKPHKHSALIKAWADGWKIQVLDQRPGLEKYTPGWLDDPKPDWISWRRYRLTPGQYGAPTI